MTVVGAFGDSFTCGEGVGLTISPDSTWAAVLARAFPGGALRSYAVAGARVADVRGLQLPLLTDPVDVATLLVGLNDVAKPGFDPAVFREHLRAVVGVLRSHADDVVLGRLHDPTSVFWLPAPLARATRERVALVNDAVDEAAGCPGVHVLDLAEVPELAAAGGWAVDRVHPSEAGHLGMAAAAADRLSRAGRHVPDTVPLPPLPPGPGLPAQGWWMVRHGVPYVTKRAAPLASTLLGRS